MSRQLKFLTLVFLTLVLSGRAAYQTYMSRKSEITRASGVKRPIQLYWFIPDGLRADPVVMKVYEWAKHGELPNLGYMLSQGSYGYSIPVFPGHTPVNTATLVTGALPEVHGVYDGSMRSVNLPLRMVSRSGFSSVTKKVPPIWYTLEERAKAVALISMPGSTPPELQSGITIRGRWGGWGFDFPAINFHTENDTELKLLQGLDHRAFGFGSELTHFTGAKDPEGWQMSLPKSAGPIREIELTNWGTTLYALIYASVESRPENYDRVIFSFDKKTALVDLHEGEWSDWQGIRLQTAAKNKNDEKPPSVDTKFKIRVIRLGSKDFFRIRFFYDSLNEFLVKPAYLHENIESAIGPMVDFADNFPPQLIYDANDKRVFIEEADMSLEWHKKMAGYILQNSESEVVLHNIYTPNQMLTSRWWLPYLDPKSARYKDVTDEEREVLWAQVKSMYQKIDAILGEVIKNSPENTYIVLSSDHGVIPLDQEVLVNNLLAKEGLLKFQVDHKTGESTIDWEKTQAIFLQMNHVYVNPNGLAKNFKRAKGPAYEKLRTRVQQILQGLKSEHGIPVFDQVVGWEHSKDFGLPDEVVGDLLLVHHPGFDAIENTTEDLSLFRTSLKGGYKQGVVAETEEGMWTPFVIMGPGVRKNHMLSKPIHHIDQYPTIMKLLHQESPSFVQGKVVDEVLE